MAYAARTKYDEPGRAARYRQRSPRREAAEGRLLARLLARLPGRPTAAWDVPCGTGRLAERLLAAGIPTSGGDLSPAMRDEAERRLSGVTGWGGAHELDLESVPTGLPRADLVVCFRFLHHLPDRATRARVLLGLKHLAGRDVFVSFHHPVSLHHWGRRFRAWRRGRPSDRHVITPRALAEEAAAMGLTWVTALPLARWRRELWLAWLRVGDEVD